MTEPPAPTVVLQGRTVRQLRRLLQPARYGVLQCIVQLRHRLTFFRDEVRVARGSYLAPGLTIGRRTRINAPSYLEPCTIGSYCAIGGRLVVRTGNHLMQFLNIEQDAQVRVIGGRPVLGPREWVTVGHGVWIGDSVVICPGVEIGNGAIIGAGSVVARSVPAYAVAVGNPARFVRWRYPETVIAQLQDVPWWTWEDEKLRRHRDLFDVDLTTVDPTELEALLREST